MAHNPGGGRPDKDDEVDPRPNPNRTLQASARAWELSEDIRDTTGYDRPY